MLWKGRRESSNVEDRRGISGGQLAAGGGIIGIVVVVLNLLLGGNVDMSQLPQRLVILLCNNTEAREKRK